MHRLTVPVVLALLLAALPVSAGKIGFVDAERVIAEVGEGKAKLAELQAWQAPYQARLDSLREQILALSDQVNAKKGTASEEEVAAIEKNQIEVMRRFEDERRHYERELESKKDEILSAITMKIGQIGAQYAEANDFDAVFVLGAQRLVYLSDRANITDQIIEIYNERYPVSSR
jgi:Skp family chaperone for outer membrane proteins